MKRISSSKRKIDYFIDSKIEKLKSPQWLIANTIILVFITEAIVMALIFLFPFSSRWIEAFLDSFLLIILLAPSLYFLLFRPLISIIEQKSETESLLKESEYFLKESQKVAYIGSYVLDIPSGYWESSVILDDLFGIDKEFNRDVDGWLQIVHPEDRAMVRGYFETNVLTNHEFFNKEYRIIRKSDQHERWVHGMGKLEFNDAGQPIKMLGTIQDITERKLMEEEYRKMALFPNLNPAPLIRFDRNGKILKLNQAAIEILGVDSESNDNLFSIIPSLEGYDLKACISENKIISLTIKVGIRTFMMTVKGVSKLDVGQIYFSDITKLHQAEDALRESEENYRSLVESTNVIPWRFDLKKNRFTFVGKQAESILGCPVESWTDIDSWANHIHPDDRQKSVDFCSFSTDQGEDHDFEYRYVSETGKIIWIHDIVTVRNDESGIPFELIGLMIDITQQKQTEDELRESEERFKRLFEDLGDAVFVTKIGGTDWGQIIEVNAAAEKQTGYSREELIGMNISKDLAVPGTGDISAAEWDKLLIEGQSVTTTEAKTRKDGTQYWVEVVVSPIDYKGLRACLSVNREITERIQTEEALRAKEEFLEAVVENIPNMLFVKDARDLRYVRYNKAGEELLGFTREQLIGKCDYDFFPKEEADFFTAKDREVLNSGAILDIPEETIQTRNHGARVLHTRKIPILDEEGKPRYLLGISEDITERIQAEKASKASESNLRSIINSEPECVKTITANGVLLDMNPAGLAMLEADTIEEVRGKNILNLVLPEHRKAFTALNKRVFKGESGALEFQIEGLKGTRLWVETYATPLFDENGKVKAHLAVTRNVTERKRAEEALQKSEERFRSLVEQIPDGVYRSTPEGRFIDVNPAMVEILGYESKEALMAVDIKKELYFEDQDRDELNESLKEAAGNDFQIFRMRHKKGHEIWVEDHGRLVFDNDGNVLYHEGVLRDITERKQTEEALLESHKRLLKAEEISHLGFLDWNIKTDDIYLSDEVYRLYGLEQGKQFKAKDFSAIVAYSDDLEYMQENLEAAIRGEKDYNIDHRIIRTDGEVIWVHVQADITLDAEGNPERLLGTIMDITERKRAEEKLKASEERFRSLYQKTPVMLHSVNREGLLIGVSDLWLQKLGYTREDVIGHSPSEFLTVASQKQALEVNIPEIWDRRASKNIQYQFLKKDGEIMDVELSAITTKDAEGEDLALAVLIDVTERKKIEQKLLESEQQFRAICSTANDSIMMMDVAGNITYCNETSEKMFGYPANKMIGNSLHKLLTPKRYQKAFEEGFKVFKKTGQGHGIGKQLELSALRRDGTEFPIELSLSGVKLKGEWHGIGFVRDISQRKEDEEKLQTMSYALEQSANVVVITDTKGNIEYVNPKFTEITGYTLEEAIGQNPRILQSGNTPREKYKKLWNSLGSGGEWRGEFQNRKKDGTLYWESASISAVKDKAGNITHFLAIKEDITERKKAEDERALLEEQLRQAQKMETMGRLAGGIAHDFNNILQAIHGYVDMCLEDLDPENQVHEDLTEVMKATNRAKDLVKQILAFSRRDAEEYKPVELHLIVREAIQLLKATLPPNIEIRQNINNYCPPVLANQGQIHQVVMNLCTNAAHAMKEKGGQLKVCLEMVTPDADFVQEHPKLSANKYVQLTIIDQGVGMKKEVMDRIFEPFFTTKGVGEGTGLGLSVVHGIVQSHGGDISVDSKVGIGTTFSVYFPAVEEAVEESTSLEEAPQHGDENILFVDDEEMVSTVIARILERSGYKVTTESNGPDALQTFQASPEKFDLVITDQMMPKMTGVKFAKELLNLRADLPIILLSGFGETVTPENAKAMGIREFVKKPVVASELAKTIANVMDGKRNNKK